MLENKKFNVILSLILAIGLWMYVVGEVNPTTEDTIRDVPIQYTNMEALAEKGLTLSSSSAESVELNVKGTRSELNRLKVKDIAVIADLADAKKGENEISLDVRVPDGVEVTKKSMNKIVVTIESIKTKEVPVEITYSGQPPEGEEPTTVKVSQEKVEISGAQSLVESVVAVKGKVEVASMGDEEKTSQVKLVPVNKKGEEVHRITVKPDTVTVTSIMNKSKKVKLSVPIVDNSTDGATRKASSPQEVTILGRADTLKQITSVTAEPVDITNATNDQTFPIVLKLPEGITLSSKNSDMEVKVTVESLADKTLKFTASDIELIGSREGFEYNFEKGLSVNVVVKGKPEVLKNISEKDIKISANVSELEEGNKTVALNVICTNQDASVSISPATAHIEVKALVNENNEE